MAIVNTRLLSHPLNWIIVLAMLIIAGIFGHLLLSLLDQEPSTGAPATERLPSGYTQNTAGV